MAALAGGGRTGGRWPRWPRPLALSPTAATGPRRAARHHWLAYCLAPKNRDVRHLRFGIGAVFGLPRRDGLPSGGSGLRLAPDRQERMGEGAPPFPRHLCAAPRRPERQRAARRRLPGAHEQGRGGREARRARRRGPPPSPPPPPPLGSASIGSVPLGAARLLQPRPLLQGSLRVHCSLAPFSLHYCCSILAPSLFHSRSILDPVLLHFWLHSCSLLTPALRHYCSIIAQFLSQPCPIPTSLFLQHCSILATFLLHS